MEKNCKSIVWFRRDLRIEDNPALAAAARDGSLLPVFIWCPKEEGQYFPGRVSRWWLKQSLIHLQQSLKSLGAELILIKAQSTLSALLDCISAVGATKVVYNHLYDPISLVRDHNIKQKLVELGVKVQSYNGELLFEPWEVYDDNGHAFTTFNAYWEKCLSMQREPVSHLPPWRLVQAAASSLDRPFDPKHKSCNSLTGANKYDIRYKREQRVEKIDEQNLSFLPFFTGMVENTAIEALGLEDESEKSSNALLGRGWSPGWSNADKAFTEFTERHLLNYSKDRLRQIVWKNERNTVGEDSAARFLKAIGLREYSRYICFNFPFTHERSLLPSLKFFPWDANLAHFKAWRQGRTDLESDILGWQYISGSLPDGHELERMDSPQIQGFNFDPEGEYVRQWLPELARMPTEWIHHPWDAPPAVLKSAGLDLGVNYPKPIIDLDFARDRLTEAIAVMRGNEATARVGSSNGADEVVFDNSETNIKLPTPNEVVKEKNLCPATSSHDQRVPSMINSKNGNLNKKRLKSREDDMPPKDDLHSCNNGDEVLKTDYDLCSTAESSSNKKQITNSRNSFSVPRSCSSMSMDAPYQVHNSSYFKNPRQEEIDTEETSSKNGATNLRISEIGLFTKSKSSSFSL
ncbi:UNVERIFIED_CONTAM: Cryptochrome-2 [Sesamum calycinum]|uniref:Cryptochrome-2 n=1 Tax=Sesamum calycinum TaxID=2727403 RepID=A0AAW2RBV2_9LAMI